MTLMAALNASLTGLRTTQTGMDVVAANVANANSVGYSRRRMAPVESVTGDQTTGVRTGDIERVLNKTVQRQLRLETSGASYTSTMARFAGELDSLFGEPGSVGALDTSLNDFTKALQGLAADPASFSTRGAALDAGGILAGRIASVAESVQTLRSDAEGRIATAVDHANHLLTDIADVDRSIVSSPGSATSPSQLDERDRLITELSQLMDVNVLTAPNGSVTLTTTGGLTLFNGGTPVTLSFDARGKLGPEAAYSPDDAERGVGTIKATTLGGITIDVLSQHLIRSGEIAAAVDLRDTKLVEVQRQLDELAAGLSRALSDRQVAGTAATNGAGQTGLQIDFTGWQPGNAITLDYQTGSGGGSRRILLIPTNGAAPATIPPGDTSDPSATIIRVDMSGGFAAAAAAIQTELTSRGINLTVDIPAANTFRFLGDAAATTKVTGVSAGITMTTTSSGNPQLPFFVDSGDGNRAFTGSFEGGSHLRGLAQRLVVNPALQAQRAQGLVNFASPPGVTPQGDATRPQLLVDALTKTTRTFSSGAGIGGPGPGYVTTVADFARRIVETQAANSEAAQRLDEGQSIALASVQSRMAEESGVNVDQEMSQLVQLQTAYGANARIITAIRDMLDLLMRM